MRAPLKAALAAALMTIGSIGLAHASITYSVSGVTLSTGGALSGSFTTDDTRANVLSFDITAPALSPFAGYRYTASSASVTASALPSQYFRLDGPNNVNELQLYFTSAGLTASGGTLLSNNAYENEPSGGNRFLAGAVSVVTAPAAVPEPGSLLVLGAAAGLGLAARSVRRRSASA